MIQKNTKKKYLFSVIMHFFPLDDLKAINDSLRNTDLVLAPAVHGSYDSSSIFSFLGAMVREGICSTNPAELQWDLRAQEVSFSLL